MSNKGTGRTRESLIRILKRQRALIFALITATFTSIALLPYFNYFTFFNSLEQSVLSLKYAVRGIADIDEDAAKIVIVKLDDASLHPILSEEDITQYPEAAKLADSWPWDRSVHGYVAQRMIDAGASVVAFDLIFPTPNPGDWAFYDVIEENAGKIAIGYDYVPSENELGETSMQERPPYDDLLPLEGEESLMGFVNIETDPDGVLRRSKLQTNKYEEKLPFIRNQEALDRMTKFAERTPPFFSLGTLAAILHDDSLRDRLPPRGQKPIINYGGLDFFPTVSYLDIILDDRFQRQKEIFQDAIVLVGPFSDFFKDVTTTPIGDMFGVESHAHITRSLLNDSFYSTISVFSRSTILVTLALALLAGNLFFKAALQKTGWTLLLIAGYLVGAQVGFGHFHTILPVVPVVWILFGAGFIFIVYDFSLSQYERSKLKGYLSRYVSPEVASVLSDESTELEALLKGANRPIAVLFSDIRGFTTLSERYTPVGLVAHLNEYFESMVDGIHRYNGVLNKYIGDAILAVWGGLFSAGPEEDCINAVSSALDMEKRIVALNEKWSQDPDKLPLAIGIGISYGDAFVGNMGHSNRMEFAVMGDVVNLGSRLEGATKQYGCGILVSEEVYQICQSRVRFREVDIIQVKGKTKGVRTFSPINFIEEPAPEWLEAWKDSLKEYRSRNFTRAKQQFMQLREDSPELALSCSLYEERCDTLIATPPPEDWDFVYVMTTK